MEKRRSQEEEEERVRKEKRRRGQRRRGKLLKTTNSNRQAQSLFFYSCNFSYIQCCGSGSMDSHWFWSPGSKSRWAKKTQKKKNVKEFIDLMCWTCMFSFEGNFSYIQSCGSGSMDPHCFGRLDPGDDSGGQKFPTGPQEKG